MKRRMQGIILVLVMLISSVSPVAASTLSGQGNASGVYKVAEGVEVIGKDAFKNNKNITSVEFSSTVREVEEYAFYGASNLKTVKFNQGLEIIGLGAFEKSGLTGSITIPGTVQKINNLAFAGIETLEKVYVEEGVKEFGVYPFSPELKELHLPSTIGRTETLYNNMYGGVMHNSSDFTIHVPKDTTAAHLVKGYKNVVLTEKNAGKNPVASNVDTALYNQRRAEMENAPSNVVAKPTAQKVMVDGKEVKFRAYNISGYNYFMLRDIAYIFNKTASQFEVGWDGEKFAIDLETGKEYTGPAVGFEMTSPHVEENGTKSTASLYKNGDQAFLLGYTIEGYTYFKLRDLGNELGFGVEWDAVNEAVVMKSDTRVAQEEPTPTPTEPNPEETENPWEAERYHNGIRVYTFWEEINEDIDYEALNPVADEAKEQEMREIMLDLINEARAKVGAGPLELDERLNEMAEYKARDMRISDMWKHEGSYGNFYDLRKMFNITNKIAGENTTPMGAGAEDMYNGWYRSKGHRENMLNPAYKKIGIGFEPHKRMNRGSDELYEELRDSARYFEELDEYTYLKVMNYFGAQAFTD